MKKSFKRIVRTNILYKLYEIDEGGFQAALPFQFNCQIRFPLSGLISDYPEFLHLFFKNLPA